MAVKNTTNHVKLEFLKEISEGSSDLMRDLITLFTTQVPTFSNQMDAYFKNNDYCNLAKLAHKIKNSVAMMGIEEFF
jgi:HPt (histidine-containing phosphotransfer) domain-containing protein